MVRLSQPTQTAAPPAPKATSLPSKSSNSRNQRVMRGLSIGEKVPPTSPLPFSSLSSPDLVELMHEKPRIGSDYKRRYDPYVQPYVDTTFNVVRAALMRKSRIEAKKYVQFKRLDGFLKLPLDIILSTLEYLHPIDIYHLSRSSFIFRDLLKDQMPLLTRIYQANGVPVWPPEISYDHWANLLFGDAICDRCQMFVALPDFVHRQRICSECFQLGFQFTHRSMGAAIVPKGFRDKGCILLDPRSTPDWQSVPYRPKDTILVQKMDSELEKMKSEGKSEEEIDEYTNEMVRQARRVEQHAEGCDLWAYRLFFDLSKDLDDSRRASLKRLEQRLTRRGHQYGNFLDRAIAVASSRWRGGHQPDHKRKSWNTTVSIIKSLALRSGTQQIHSERTQMMELGYVKYIQRPHPQPQSQSNPTSSSSSSTTQSASSTTHTHSHRPTWSYPPPEIFMSSTPCKSLINKPTTGPQEPQERKYISRIRGLFDDEDVKRWCTRVKKDDLERRVTIPKGLLSSPKGQGHESKMGLAIATFTCSMCRDFVRWKEPPPTPSRQPGQNGGGGVSRHYTLGTESSLARSSVPSGSVSKLDDPAGLVLFGWEEVKNHLVCVERPEELKNRIKNGSRIGVGSGRCGHGMEQPTLTKSTIGRSSNPSAPGVEGIVFNTKASEVMLIVLGKLGLDPAKTTADDLDGLGKGFLCYDLSGVRSGMKPKFIGGAGNTKVLGWRDFVIYILRYGQRDRPVSSTVDKLLVRVVSIDGNSGRADT